MKIRSITTGTSLQTFKETDKIQRAELFNQQAKQIFQNHQYEVQTTRISTNPWEEYLQNISPSEIIHQMQLLDKFCQNQNISFFSIGYANHPENITLIPEIIKNTTNIFTSSKIGDIETGINFNNIEASAKTIQEISKITPNGFGNFRFCAWANCQAGIPFFPASYHQGETSFSLALEYTDLVMAVFSQSGNLLEAEINLQKVLNTEFEKIAEIAEKIAQQFSIYYLGIDTSLAPPLNQKTSIAYAYESLLKNKFGDAGTLAVSGMLTRILKTAQIQICGYSGLMLPVCEDIGLTKRADEKIYNISNLLSYSAVCGCGLDTVPLPGNITQESLSYLLLDIATLAIKLNKPLSARLFPMPGKIAGEMTDFRSPYLVDCQIFAVQ
ncbi:DUF711 family protein [Calothrix sp. 336/3]|uniref:DUF711 family protein n=1 Tax=Calothrix sp. 336/3 TaxID=1337936 RepID=UPI0004E36D0C|nr:DUF711 family protein [Calothrix sp. 336/3]AKG20811.1 hypothetical protein IJ00_05355 [Calothrix sp. 336/3]